MKTERGFAPRWSSPPSDTINEILEMRGISKAQFAQQIDLPIEDVERLLSGSDDLPLEVARRLSNELGASPDFWVNRFCQYQDDRERVAAAEWTEALPIAELGRMGWIRKETDWRDRIDACLEFFGVPDFSTWELNYHASMAAAKFRRNKQDQIPPALTAWLRMGELTAPDVDRHMRWDADAFRAVLPEAKTLTRQADPGLFIPRLQELCARAGVTLLVLPAPTGCHASGVTRYLTDRPSIQMSARYLSDDHFWFTFFHEAAHLILHSSQDMFVDELDYQIPTESVFEADADAFASQTLIPVTAQELRALPRDRRSIIGAAREWGVSPGVLIGQLQHYGIVKFEHLNGYKRRYRWSGSTLERA